MARIRTIKPDFFQSEDVATLSYRARLTWIGLWTYVDDAGRCKDNARLIKGHVWPLEDEVTAKEVEEDLAELSAGGRIVRYSVAGDKLIQVQKWTSHQRLAKPTPSRLPAFPGTDTEEVPNLSDTPTGKVAEDSHTPTGGKGKEVEVEREVEGRPSGPHLIPEDFTLTPERKAWAATNTPAVNAELETAAFIDYWRGERKKKTNWETTWRNRMRTKQGDAEARGWKPPALDLNNPANWK